MGGFWSQGVSHESVTPGGRMVTLAFAIFVVLTLSGYTANLAAFLVNKDGSIPTGYHDLCEVVEDGQKLCMWGSVFKSFVANHPKAAESVEPCASTQECMEKLDTGVCGGVVNSELENKNALSLAEHCNKHEVGHPVMTLMLSQPVNEQYMSA